MNRRIIVVIGIAALLALGFILTADLRPGIWLRDRMAGIAVEHPAGESIVQQRPGSHHVTFEGTLGLGCVGVEGFTRSSDRDEGYPARNDWTPGVTNWGKFRVELPMEVGWNSVWLRTKFRDHQTIDVSRVAVGELFIVAGQSNAAGASDALFTTESNHVRRGTLNSAGTLVWGRGDDPQTPFSGGSPWPLVGDALVDKLSRPIGFINVAEGGSSILDWNEEGRLFQRLVAALNATRPHYVRAILWAQGESDSELSSEQYRRHLSELIANVDRALERGLSVPWLVAVSTQKGNQSFHAVRRAQESVIASGAALPGPDTDSLGREFRARDGTHFNQEGTIRLASLWTTSIWENLFRETMAPEKPGAEGSPGEI
ncbi:sialate O-acetylesterase [Synoicihabitans lomoniglobus]|uniref:Sialate O-acetylesterase n=1 Tax=Synoicihabitans lomoniglobus TaxID=2909285 RepID=A0AAF0CQU8_9BACT|nr:sialate O-acetylesterase [Opitutaceae bacterium LMO-M01]WED66363.1 sialate O-acetylesterase [Opitutaceae bacterium LMO-M01]